MHMPLQCRCGAVRGTIDVDRGLRVMCYCDDCQAYAHALGRDDVLDAHGGTDIWQTTPSRLKLSDGLEHLRCMRLSDKGMLRFYTACCSTPVGNTMSSAKVPFVGVVHAMMDHRAHGRDEVLGPAVGTQGRFARGGVPPGAHATVPLAFVPRVIAFLVGGVLARAWRPTPLFDGAGAPVVVPRVLSAAERDALRVAT